MVWSYSSVEWGGLWQILAVVIIILQSHDSDSRLGSWLAVVMLQHPAVTICNLHYQLLASKVNGEAGRRSQRSIRCLQNAATTLDLPSDDNWDSHNCMSLPPFGMFSWLFGPCLGISYQNLFSLTFWYQSHSLKQSLVLVNLLILYHVWAALIQGTTWWEQSVKSVLYLLLPSVGYLDFCSPDMVAVHYLNHSFHTGSKMYFMLYWFMF